MPNRLWLNRGSGGPAVERLAQPTGLAATAISGNSIYMEWTDNANGESSYWVDRSSDGTTGWSQIAVLPANSSSYLDTAVNCEGTFYYRVRAFGESEGLYSAYSHLANATTLACSPPAAPTNLAASAISTTQINLSWSDNATDESGYRVERSPDGSAWSQIADLPAGTTTYSNTSLSCGTQYFYRVRAYRSGDGAYSSYSNAASATTELCTLDSPTDLSASMVSCSRIDLRWTDNAADETSYHIDRSPDGLTDWIEIAVLPAQASVYSNSGLACDTEYHFRVRAYRESDDQYSQYSNTTTMRTDLCSYWIFLPVIIKNLSLP
jgi:hypothetical protein